VTETRPTNKFGTRCHQCKVWLEPGRGFLDGKDDDTGRFLVICVQCDAFAIQRATTPLRGELATELRIVGKQWFRTMSRTVHPDMGGSVEQQKIVNACYELLMEAIERWEKQQS
jgi:hypothetical protein